MTENEHLQRAPIQEAIIDIRCAFPPDIDRLRQLAPILAADYPKMEERRFYQTEIKLLQKGTLPTSAATQRIGPDGFRFWSPDGKRLVQARFDGFTMNWLPPYKDWEALCSEARRRWEHITAEIQPESIGRAIVRFINNMDLPCSVSQLDRYLTVSPTVPPSFRTGTRRCMGRMEFPGRQDGTDIVINLMMHDTGPERCQVLLDIETSVARPFAVGNDEDLWGVIEALRDVKNDAFFESITDETKELYL